MLHQRVFYTHTDDIQLTIEAIPGKFPYAVHDAQDASILSPYPPSVSEERRHKFPLDLCD